MSWNNNSNPNGGRGPFTTPAQEAARHEALNQIYQQAIADQQRKQKQEAEQSSLKQFKTRILPQMAMGYCMGQLVGSSGVAMSYALNGISLRGAGIRTCLGAGAAFGCIFAVGSLIR